MLFREHRGLLSDSMETMEVVSSLSDIWDIVKKDLTPYGIKNDLRIEYYGCDSRIGWDTYIITIPGYGVLGFTNGLLGRSISIENRSRRNEMW